MSEPHLPDAHLPERRRALAARWLGVGLAAAIAVVTLGLAVSGRLTLYISPDTVWFASAAAVLMLIGAVWTCVLPLGAESDHGHDHGHDHADAGSAGRRTLSRVGAWTAGILASAVVLAALVLPPASLSAEIAMQRAGESTVLFAGADDVDLGVADTTTFGVGDWANAFANATRPEDYDGATVTLTGFVTPSAGEKGSLGLTRMVITHCVIDARPASVPVDEAAGSYETGDWIEVTGTVKADADGALRIEPTDVKRIKEPKDPYEY
ncbi:TIGR03943 family protein [Microbacterium sp. KUDC0406]|uniref:TIGR03943 family putative permease subunit n=1 Tax=Microbacterium sp. KUDC0406 TaxID=2909588 RepID=UPI001F346F30|nr:TIGR03943 family protein [Microbacterium sp. KUDC0406]UJP09046.1 TIGR03943 family protein [Microbacterium sp. KUDC0406]